VVVIVEEGEVNVVVVVVVIVSGVMGMGWIIVGSSKSPGWSRGWWSRLDSSCVSLVGVLSYSDNARSVTFSFSGDTSPLVP